MTARLESIVEATVVGMGYQLVELQASNRGRLLRIFIDKPGGITVEDCAGVSRQLSRVFEVEGIGYERLEISSPGLDRPLRAPQDFERFAGQRVDVRMRAPDANGRRRFIGVLRGLDAGAARLEVDGASIALALDGMERARLVPELGRTERAR